MKVVKKGFRFIKLNANAIIKNTIRVAGTIFTLLSIVLSFFQWEDIGIIQPCCKILIFILLITLSILIAFIIIVFTKSHTIWENGSAEIKIHYADIMKLAFEQKHKKKIIVVIPVNTCFDTQVDKSISESDKPLVSPNTLHGKWIENMINHNKSQEQLDEMIDKYIEKKEINLSSELSEEQKKRGKRKCYKRGTVVSVEGNKNVTFFLLALSEFDDKNNAQCSKDELIECLHRLILCYNEIGQGYDLYLPLMGTNLSRAGLSHNDSLQTIISVLRLYSDKIHGSVNIIVYNKDRDKVTIFKD